MRAILKPVHISVAPNSTLLYHSYHHHQASGMQTDAVIHCLNIILNPHWTVSCAEISASFLSLLYTICVMMDFHILIAGGWEEVGFTVKQQSLWCGTWGLHIHHINMCTKCTVKAVFFLPVGVIEELSLSINIKKSRAVEERGKRKMLECKNLYILDQLCVHEDLNCNICLTMPRVYWHASSALS